MKIKVPHDFKDKEHGLKLREAGEELNVELFLTKMQCKPEIRACIENIQVDLEKTHCKYILKNGTIIQNHLRWKSSYPSTRRWLDMGEARDAGEWYACQVIYKICKYPS